jgi:hypothetical protein
MKKPEPQFKIGDVVRVIEPCMVINIKDNSESKKLDVEDICLVGDEGLVIAEITYLERQKEYLYRVLTENSLDAMMYELSEQQITLFD